MKARTLGEIGLRRADEAPADYGPGRKCSHRGCTITLNRYHEGTRCYAHERPIRLSDHEANHRQRVADFAELME